jgi:hypothetical protein
MSRRHSETALSNLREGLQRLFRDYSSESEQVAGMRHLLDSYLMSLIGEKGRPSSVELNWKTPS